MNDFFKDFEVIHSYSRKEAINDRVLMDVSNSAKDIGILYPVAVSQAVWAKYVFMSDEQEDYEYLEEQRLLDILFKFKRKAEQTKGPDLLFEIFVQFTAEPEEVTLKAVCGPGDRMEPVITIMEVNED